MKLTEKQIQFQFLIVRLKSGDNAADIAGKGSFNSLQYD